MKRLLFILLISALCGCSTTRKVSLSTETQIVNKTEADVVQKRDKDSTTRIAEGFRMSDSKNRKIEITITVFDTDKPADSTGRHPVKSETKIKASGQSDLQTQSVRQEETNLHESDSVADRSKYDLSAKVKSMEESKTQRAVSWWVYLVAAVVVVAAFKKLFKKLF